MVSKLVILILSISILCVTQPLEVTHIDNRSNILTDIASLDALNVPSIQNILKLIVAALEATDIKVNEACINILKEIANGFENKTTIILSAAYNSGKDINDLGRYENCLDANNTRYVALSVSGFPVNLYLGVCGPAECTEDDYNASRELIATLANEIIKESNFETEYFTLNFTQNNFYFSDAVSRNQAVHTFGAGQIVTILLIFSLCVCVAIGSCIQSSDSNTGYKMKILKKFASESDENIEEDFFDEECKHRSACKRFFKCFSFVDNIKKLTDSRIHESDKSLEFLNGIRVISILWIILGHTYFYMMKAPLSNPLEPALLIKTFSFSIVCAAPYVVDIFFWTTGFLGAYIMLIVMNKKKGELPNPIFSYLHRYFRLIPLYIIALLLFWFVMPVVGDGPVFYNLQKKADNCSSYWWSHLLMINNFYPILASSDDCMSWTSYLANDFQFFILIPLFVWLLYHKNSFGLVILFGIQALSHIITLGVIFSYNLESSFFMTNDEYVYKPYNRIGPFIIGVYVAYSLYLFKFEQSSDSKIKKFMDEVSNSLCTRLCICVIGTFLFLAMIFVFYPMNSHPENFGTAFNAVFLAFSKTVFIIGFSLMILPLLVGKADAVRSLLSGSIMIPLSRLSYGVFMLHPTFMMFEAYNQQRGIWMSTNLGILNFLGWIVASFTCAFVLYLLVEAPFMNIEKEFFVARSKRKPKRKLKSRTRSRSQSSSGKDIKSKNMQKEVLLKSGNKMLGTRKSSYKEDLLLRKANSQSNEAEAEQKEKENVALAFNKYDINHENDESMEEYLLK